MATEKTSRAESIHVESNDAGLDHLKDVALHDKALANQALEGTAQEHNSGVWQAFKSHKRAAIWSVRTCIVFRRGPR